MALEQTNEKRSENHPCAREKFVNKLPETQPDKCAGSPVFSYL